jgi:hypothetical protein
MNINDDYGTHSALVIEVIALAEKFSFFSVEKSQSNTGVMVVDDFDQAQTIAWEETFGEDEYTWNDIRANAMAAVRAIQYQDHVISDETHEKFKDLPATLFTKLKRSLDRRYHSTLDDAASDLYQCAYSRAICGRNNIFFESMFESYVSGSWPCGWESSYPSGRMVVYRPSVK